MNGVKGFWWLLLLIHSMNLGMIIMFIDRVKQGVFSPKLFGVSFDRWRQYQWRCGLYWFQILFYNFSEIWWEYHSLFIIFLTKSNCIRHFLHNYWRVPVVFLNIPQSAPSSLRRFQPTPSNAMPWEVSRAHVLWSSWAVSGDENEEKRKVIGFIFSGPPGCYSFREYLFEEVSNHEQPLFSSATGGFSLSFVACSTFAVWLFCKDHAGVCQAGAQSFFQPNLVNMPKFHGSFFKLVSLTRTFRVANVRIKNKSNRNGGVIHLSNENQGPWLGWLG